MSARALTVLAAQTGGTLVIVRWVTHAWRPEVTNGPSFYYPCAIKRWCVGNPPPLPAHLDTNWLFLSASFWLPRAVIAALVVFFTLTALRWAWRSFDDARRSPAQPVALPPRLGLDHRRRPTAILTPSLSSAVSAREEGMIVNDTRVGRSMTVRVRNPSGFGLRTALLLSFIPLTWPLVLYMVLRYLTGHRAARALAPAAP
jgi:hypothetical protein